MYSVHCKSGEEFVRLFSQGSYGNSSCCRRLCVPGEECGEGVQGCASDQDCLPGAQGHRFFHFNKFSHHGEFQHNCKIACQVLKINVHLSIVIFLHKKFLPRVFLEWDIPIKLRESIRDKGERKGKSGRRGFQGSRVMSRGSRSRSVDGVSWG